MPFSHKIKQNALVFSRRCCCVCHEFIGRNANVHHIIQEAIGGPNTIDNAIVLCLNCHAEAGHYNLNHPLGIQYSPEELRKHRDFWWQWVKDNPSKPLPKFPLVISPYQININRGSWHLHSSLKIFNKTDYPLYQIWVKIYSNSQSVDLRKINIDPVSAIHEDETEFQIRNINWNTKALLLLGKDERKTRCIFLLINSIDPKNTLTFKIRNNNSIYLQNMTIHLTFEIIDYSEEPPDVLSSEDNLALSIIPPENITINRLSVMMSKKP